MLNNHKSIKMVHPESKGEITSSLEPQLNPKVVSIIITQNTNSNTYYFHTNKIREKRTRKSNIYQLKSS